MARGGIVRHAHQQLDLGHKLAHNDLCALRYIATANKQRILDNECGLRLAHNPVRCPRNRRVKIFERLLSNPNGMARFLYHRYFRSRRRLHNRPPSLRPRTGEKSRGQQQKQTVCDDSHSRKLFAFPTQRCDIKPHVCRVTSRVIRIHGHLHFRALLPILARLRSLFLTRKLAFLLIRIP